MRLREFIPRPMNFGIEGRPKLPIRKELQTLRKRDTAVISEAKSAVGALTQKYPGIVLSEEDLNHVRPGNIAALYKLPAKSLIYKSPHNIRHFAATDVLATFIGKYANEVLVKNGQQPLDVEALRYSAWTHDSFRSRFDILGTIVNYQLHGIRASEDVEDIIQRGGLPKPQSETLQLVQEINRYHDVDKRPYAHRSRETEVFTTIDKLEIVRLFRPIQLRFKLPGISQGIRMLSRKRMRAYEGSRQEFMGIMGDFLPIVDGLYRLSMQHIQEERKIGKKWEEVDQHAAVIRAARELGIIVPVAAQTEQEYSGAMATSIAPEVRRKEVPQLPQRQLIVQEHTLLDSKERSATAARVIAHLKGVGGVLPTVAQVEKYQTQPSFFRNPDQAGNSIHNIRHHAGVEIGTVLLSADIAARQPELLQSLGLTHEAMQDMLLRVASVHDSGRMYDDKESEPTKSDVFLHLNPYRTVAKHGQEIVQLLRDKPQDGPDASRYLAIHQAITGLSSDQQDIFLAIVGNHDNGFGRAKRQLAKDPAFAGNEQKLNQALFLLDVFKIADNMELVRSFYQYKEERGVRQKFGHEWFVNHRLFHYKTHDRRLQDLFSTYVPVIAELYQQTRHNNADQFTAVMNASQQMGILRAQ